MTLRYAHLAPERLREAVREGLAGANVQSGVDCGPEVDRKGGTMSLFPRTDGSRHAL